MRPRLLSTLLSMALVGGLAVFGPALAKPKAPVADEELDRIVVAAVLIGDAHYDRALRVLDEVDPAAQAEEFDAARYWRLKGLCHMQLGATGEAVQDFKNAIAAGEANPEVWLRLAQAQQALGDHEAALASLDQAGDAANAMAGGFMLRARSYTALERYEDAWNALQAGRAAFPDDVGFDRETLYLLIQLGLYQQAREVGQRYLERTQDEPLAWLAVGEALRRSGNLNEAAGHLEATRIRFPDELDAYTLLARTYVDLRQPGACGSVLQIAAELDPALAAASADCYRDAGRLDKALYMNSLVPDAKSKARQRLDLLVRDEAWEQALAVLPRLETLGLLDEDPIAYAAAYTFFQVGRYEQAEDALKRIDDARLFQDAAALRKAMADCETNPTGCY